MFLVSFGREGKQAVQSWLDLDRAVQKPMKLLTFRFLFGSVARLVETEQRLASLKEKNPENYAFHKMVRDGTRSDDDVREAIEEIHE